MQPNDVDHSGPSPRRSREQPPTAEGRESPVDMPSEGYPADAVGAATPPTVGSRSFGVPSAEDLPGRSGPGTAGVAGLDSRQLSTPVEIDLRSLEEARRAGGTETGPSTAKWAAVTGFLTELGRVCRQADVHSWAGYATGLLFEAIARKDLGKGLPDTAKILLIGAGIILATDAKNEIMPTAVQQVRRRRAGEPVEVGKTLTATVSALAYASQVVPLAQTVLSIRTDNPDPTTVQLDLTKLEKVFGGGSVATGLHAAALFLHLRQQMPDNGRRFAARVYQAMGTCATTADARKFLTNAIGEGIVTFGRALGNANNIIIGNAVQLGHDMTSMAVKRYQNPGSVTATLSTGTAVLTLGAALGSVGQTWNAVDRNNPVPGHVTASGSDVRYGAYFSGAAAVLALATAALNFKEHWRNPPRESGRSAEPTEGRGRGNLELRSAAPASDDRAAAVAQLQSPGGRRSDAPQERRTSTEDRRRTSDTPVPGTVERAQRSASLARSTR